MVSLSMTLSDPWPGFQGHGSFKRRDVVANMLACVHRYQCAIILFNGKPEVPRVRLVNMGQLLKALPLSI